MKLAIQSIISHHTLLQKILFEKSYFIKLLIHNSRTWSKAWWAIVIKAKSKINLSKWPTFTTLTKSKWVVSAGNYKTNASYFMQTGPV